MIAQMVKDFRYKNLRPKMWEGKEQEGENNGSIPKRNRMWAARGPEESVHTLILGTLGSS